MGLCLVLRRRSKIIYSLMTKNEYKKIVDKFLEEKYRYLMDCANNIMKKKSGHSVPGDLVGELVIFLYDNQSKLQAYVDIEMLLGFSVSWLKIQSQYRTTPFARKYEPTPDSINIDDILERPSDEPMIDIDDMDIDAYVKDLKTIYTDRQITNILKIHDIYPTLSGIGKIVFDAYFIEGLSMDKIRQKYSFFREKNGKKVFSKGRQSIFYMLRDLKEEIKGKL